MWLMYVHCTQLWNGIDFSEPQRWREYLKLCYLQWLLHCPTENSISSSRHCQNFKIILLYTLTYSTLWRYRLILYSRIGASLRSIPGQVVPEEFFSGFANIFRPQVVSKNFLDRQGVTQHPKIFPECYKCFLLFMFIYVRRHYAAKI